MLQEQEKGQEHRLGYAVDTVGTLGFPGCLAKVLTPGGEQSSVSPRCTGLALRAQRGGALL